MQEQRSLIPVISHLPLYNTWLGMSWGSFGWANVWFPRWVYAIFAAATVGVGGGFAWWLTRLVRAGRRPDRRLVLAAGFLGLMVLFLLAGVHLKDYELLVGPHRTFAQGRYLLPLLPLGGLVVAGAAELAGPRRHVAAATWLGGLVALQLASFALVVSRFYA